MVSVRTTGKDGCYRADSSLAGRRKCCLGEAVTVSVREGADSSLVGERMDCLVMTLVEDSLLVRKRKCCLVESIVSLVGGRQAKTSVIGQGDRQQQYSGRWSD